MGRKRFLDSLPLRNKLIVIIFTASATVSLAATSVYLIYNLHTLRTALANNALLIAHTVAGYSAADLAFRDHVAANQTLAGLANVPHIANAFLYDTNGQMFASLRATPKAVLEKQSGRNSLVIYHSNFLHVIQPVVFQNKLYGNLYLLVSLEPLRRDIRNGLLTLAGLLVFALLLSLLLALYLQGRVSGSIKELADAAQRISRENDYNVRVNPTTDDEIGSLGVSFNTMMERIKAHESALDDANRALHAVSACSASMVYAQTEQQLLKDVCRVIVESAGYRMAWIGRAEHDEARSVIPVAWFGFEDEYLKNIYCTWADEPSGRGPTGTAIRTGKPVVARQIITDPQYAPWRAAALQRGYESSIALPLRHDKATFGALNIYAGKPDAFSGQELELLTGLAHDLTFGIYAMRTRSERDQALTVLSRRTAEFQAMFNAIPDAVMFADTQRRIVLNNPAVHTMFGYSDKELLGQSTQMLYADPRDFNEQGRKRFHTGTYANTNTYEVRYKRKDGKIFWTESLGAQVKDGDGNLLGFIGIFRDITERRQARETIRALNIELEQRVKKRTAELESANKELETFSYSVSHDLRAPLRSIDGFAHALEEDYGRQLDPTAHDYLHRVRKASQHMGLLIDDMLNLSRVSRAPLKFEPLNLSEMAQEVIDELRSNEPDRAVDIQVESGMTAVADPVLFRVALQNLLDNAWKYTRRVQHPHIVFSTMKRQNSFCYYVQDNGSGFDMKYADKLFTPFQRLHRSADFEGTGIGLATVARIIRRHGGRIWVDAAIDKGATFYFTLSDSQHDPHNQ